MFVIVWEKRMFLCVWCKFGKPACGRPSLHPWWIGEGMLVCPQELAQWGPCPPREAALPTWAGLLILEAPAAWSRRHLLNDLSQVVLEGGRVQLLILTAQGLSGVVCPLKPHKLLPAHCEGDKQKYGGESWAWGGWAGIQENQRLSYLPPSSHLSLAEAWTPAQTWAPSRWPLGRGQISQETCLSYFLDTCILHSL